MGGRYPAELVQGVLAFTLRRNFTYVRHHRLFSPRH